VRGNVVIAGIGHTEYGKLPGRSPTSMNVEATRNALADAGICKDMVDGLFVKYPTSGFLPMYGQTMAEALGIVPRIGGVWDQGGATNISMISLAAMAIEHGQCEVAVVTMADNPKTGSRQAYERAWGDDEHYGWVGTAAGFAMIARRHLAENGITSDDLAAVAIACRENAVHNPRAQLQIPLTLEGYRASPMIVDPLRRDDCCLVSDGGAAVVLMSASRAAALGVADPVPVLGFGQGQTSWEVVQRPQLVGTGPVESADTAFRMAGMKPADIDVAQIYDCFTITVLTTLEAYGFCGDGQSGAFVRDGAIGFGGSLPINTSGGLLAESGMPGMQLVHEGVRQVRGTSTRQVQGARNCIVSNQGGIMHTHSTLILGDA